MRHSIPLRAVKLVSVGVGLLFLPSVVRAQQADDLRAKLEAGRPAIAVTADLGMYVPAGSLVLDSTVRMRGVPTIVLGARASLPLHDRLALQATLGWSPSLVAQSDWKQTVDLEGGIWLASLRSRVRLNRESRGAVETFLAPGFGLVHRYGSAWTGWSGGTDLAVVLGAGARFREPGSRWSFALTLDDYLSRTGFTDSAGTRYGGRLHNDVLFAVGVTVDAAPR